MKTLNDVILLRSGSKEQNWNLLIQGSDFPGQFKAIHARQHDVEDREVEVLLLQTGEAAAAQETPVTVRVVRTFEWGTVPTFSYHYTITGLKEQQDLGLPLLGGERVAREEWPESPLNNLPEPLRAVTPDDVRHAPALAQGGPVHMHRAEQVAEVEEIEAAHGRRPVEWMLDNAAPDARWCLIHCTQMQPHVIDFHRRGKFPASPEPYRCLPGLIDTHVHLATVPNRRGAEAELHRMLYAGVTAVRDMAGDAQSRATGLLDQVRDKSQLNKLQSAFDTRVADAMDRLNVPSKNDIDAINKKLNKIIRLLDEQGKPAAKKKTTRKRAAKKPAARKKAASRKTT